MRGLDVEVQQPRHREVHLLDLLQVDPVPHTTQAGQVIDRQTHRVVFPQPGPTLATEHDIRARQPGLQ